MKRARVLPTVRVVHVCPPIRVSIDSSNFRAVVQELTGNGLTPGSCGPHDRQSKLPEASSPASSSATDLHHCTTAPAGAPSKDMKSTSQQYYINGFLPNHTATGIIPDASTIILSSADGHSDDNHDGTDDDHVQHVDKQEECDEVIQEQGEGAAYYASLYPCLKQQSMSTPLISLQDQAPNCIRCASPLTNQTHAACMHTDNAHHTSLIEGNLELEEEEEEQASCNTYNTWSTSEDSSQSHSVLLNGSSEVDSRLLQRRGTVKPRRHELEDGHDQGFMVAAGKPRKKLRSCGPNQTVYHNHRSDMSMLSGMMQSSASFSSSDSSIVSAWDQFGAAEAPAMINGGTAPPIEDDYELHNHDDYDVNDRVRASSDMGACNMIVGMQTLVDQYETQLAAELWNPSAAAVPLCSDFQYITDLITLNDLSYHTFESFLLS